METFFSFPEICSRALEVPYTPSNQDSFLGKEQLFIETSVPKSHPWCQQVFAESELAIARGTMSDTWYVPAIVSLIVWSSCVVFWSASMRVWWVNRSTHGFPLACEPWRISPCAQCWLLCSGEIPLDDSYHLENLFLQVDFSGLVSSYESERLSYGFPWSYVISPLMLLVGIRPLQGSIEGQSKLKGIRVLKDGARHSVNILVTPPL